MAKKKSSVSVRFNFDSSFSVKIPEECLASFTKDLNRNEAALNQGLPAFTEKTLSINIMNS